MNNLVNKSYTLDKMNTISKWLLENEFTVSLVLVNPYYLILG